MTRRMHNPTHPGEALRDLCIDPLGITVTEAAAALGVSRKTLSGILNGRQGISAEMALRIAKAFGSDAQLWLEMQQNHDLWQASQRGVDKHVKCLVAA